MSSRSVGRGRPARVALAAVLALALCAWAVSPSFAAGKRPHHCSGTAKSPGVLKAGTYRHGLIVSGVCLVNDGAARVIGLVTVKPGAALIAAFGMKDSKLRVDGDILVGHGAVLVLGCNTTSFTCADDPNANTHPTLTSFGRVTGNVISTKPLGVIIHSSRIDGNVEEDRGGGGAGKNACNPPSSGPFAVLGAPVFSAYDDNVIGGEIKVSNVKTCWIGAARDKVGKSMSFFSNTLADPDGIEILSNHIHGNLVCKRNGHSPGVPAPEPVWDSSEASFQQTTLYPRHPWPNTVHGKRLGQCRKASPATMGGPLGPGPF